MVDYRAAKGIHLDQVPDQWLELDAVAGSSDDDVRLNSAAIREHYLSALKAVHRRDDLDLSGLDGFHEAVLDRRSDPALMDGRFRSQWREGQAVFGEVAVDHALCQAPDAVGQRHWQLLQHHRRRVDRAAEQCPREDVWWRANGHAN